MSNREYRIITCEACERANSFPLQDGDYECYYCGLNHIISNHKISTYQKHILKEEVGNAQPQPSSSFFTDYGYLFILGLLGLGGVFFLVDYIGESKTTQSVSSNNSNYESPVEISNTNATESATLFRVISADCSHENCASIVGSDIKVVRGETHIVINFDGKDISLPQISEGYYELETLRNEKNHSYKFIYTVKIAKRNDVESLNFYHTVAYDNGQKETRYFLAVSSNQ
jgi:hypothetical protein